MKKAVEPNSQPPQKSAAESGHSVRQTFADGRAQGSLAQLASMMNQSPRVQTQLKLAEKMNQPPSSTFQQPAQMKGKLEEKKPTQMKGKLEEKKALQGKFDSPIQEKRLEEKKPAQTKSKLEDKKLAQMKGKLDEKKPAQTKPNEEKKPVQGRFEDAAGTAQLEEVPAANRTGLPDPLKTGVESLSDISLDDVKVHYNSDKPKRLNALAYAQGTDIHVGPGQEKHLPHEAWHVVQQKQGRVQPTMQMKVGVPVNDDPRLEREADAMGAQALQTVANRSTLVQRQLRSREEIQQKQRQRASAAPVPQTAQLVLDVKNVKEKADKFLSYHSQEAKLIREANALLSDYSQEPSQQKLAEINKALPAIRDQIILQTDAQAAIIAEYAACDVEAVRKTFLDVVLEKNAQEMRPLFDKLLSQTTTAEEVDEKFKYRFLSYVLQSSKFVTGEGRFRELMNLLGDRQVVIGTRRFGAPLAGLESPEDDPKSEKTNVRNKEEDAELLKAKGGNLAEFVKAKREQGETRVANPRKDTIGNIQIDMDSSQKVFPVYFGLTGKKEVEAYTAPMFTAIHHEVGHAVNRLKGRHGRKTDKYTPEEGLLSKLTDEEELQNISLDRYSDKVFTDELGLPERIAHGAFTNLDAQEMPFREQDLKGALQQWDSQTYKMDELRQTLLQKIRSVSFKDWTPYTVNGEKPAGIKKISDVLVSLQTSRRGVLQQLEKVRSLAKDSHDNPSLTRTKTTSKFYEVVSGMKFDSPENLNAALLALATAWSPFFPSEDPTPGLWTKEEARRVWESRERGSLTEFPRLPRE